MLVTALTFYRAVEEGDQSPFVSVPWWKLGRVPLHFCAGLVSKFILLHYYGSSMCVNTLYFLFMLLYFFKAINAGLYQLHYTQ